MITYHDAVNDALERLDDLGYERALGGGDLANHGPMGAEALAVLGHGDAVPEWIEVYRNAAPHHDPPVPYQRLDGSDEADWRSALGDIARAGDFEELFGREIAEDGWQAVLMRWWPRLLPGPMTGLTHGLIRTAHAVRGLAATNEPTPLQLRELARGLGYWAARFVGAPGRGHLVGALPVPAALAAVPRLPDPPRNPREGLARMRDPHSMPGYADALDVLAPDHIDRLLSDMTANYAGICVAHSAGGFPIPLLHGVTAPAAARLVLPQLPPEWHAPTAAALWQAQVTLLMMITTGRDGEDTALARAQRAEVPAWDELIGRAVDHGDEHVIKFTEACLREHSLRPDPRYAWAVDIAQRLIERPDDPAGSAVAVRFGRPAD
ncbi:questin oxidase family protein [Nocardia sp. CDC159]|uniref:Questin oxidase family protein n=1 Tax=Nocardia pulmonis TaxID=2951408 RepID=A0A9X2E6M3_9NOCA|nr:MULTISPECIES: questin oxidase family protein [Nocardia]MCM6774621.1 questin oxidase family protein [Nocardia pulmonis]MCM6787314.1 questin oxidase family protein [Nocardia sp. CDC159]